MSKGDWKKHLFRSGLPLEHVVTEKLAGLGFSVFGEYPYLRPNEHKVDTEFSVDLRSFQPLTDDQGHVWSAVDLLIECKYVHAGCRWVFAPFPSPHTYPIGVVNTIQELCTSQIDESSIFDFEETIPYCVRGIELCPGSANLPNVRHGLYQLRYAVPVLIGKEIESQIKANDDWLSLTFICPILITTASLHLLKREISLEQLEQASDLDEVSDHVEALIFNQQPGPQLEDFARKQFEDVLEKHPRIERRLEILASVLGGPVWKRRSKPDLDWLRRTFEHSTERVLIINYQNMEKVIQELMSHIKSTESTLTSYGTIAYDEDGSEIMEATTENNEAQNGS